MLCLILMPMRTDGSGYHILTHANGGRHFFSTDARRWYPAPTGPHTQAFPKAANFTDGSAAPYGDRFSLTPLSPGCVASANTLALCRAAGATASGVR